MPTLHPSHPTNPKSEDKAPQADDEHPGARVAETAAAIDAFRPSASFNELTNLLPQRTTNSSLKGPPEIQTLVANSPTTNAANYGKKRKAGTPPHDIATTKKQSTLGIRTKAAVASTPSSAMAAQGNADCGSHNNATSKLSIPSNPATAKLTTGNITVVPVTATSNAETAAQAVTETDFKTVAQAAVSSLIQGTKTGEVIPTRPEGDQVIDTSTTHIKALTGTNWVAACSGAAGGGEHVSAADAKAGNRTGKKVNMSADERARQNRDRNREHARNTRLRKKAYVEELKKTLT